MAKLNCSRTQLSEYAYLQVNSDVIDFRVGQPSRVTLPVEELKSVIGIYVVYVVVYVAYVVVMSLRYT